MDDFSGYNQIIYSYPNNTRLPLSSLGGLQLKDFSCSQTRDWKRMSLHRNQIESVPKDFVYTQLLSLILSENPLTYNVGWSFLTNLTALRVLDLSNTQIESVPTSVSQLEFLKLRCTCIRELPRDIGNLSNLQFLDIQSVNI